MTRAWFGLTLMCLGCAGDSLYVTESQGNSAPTGSSLLTTSELECPDQSVARPVRSNCWPTGHVGQWSGVMIPTADSSATQLPGDRMLLQVLQTGAAEVQFPAPLVDSGPGREVLATSPPWAPDTPYTTLDVQMFGGPEDLRQLDRNVLLQWPAPDSSPSPASRQPLRLDLRLSVDGQAMRGIGVYGPPQSELPLEVELVRLTP